MSFELTQFSEAQWEFLAVIDAFGGSAGIHLIELLAPLAPSALLDILDRGARLGLVAREESGSFALPRVLPEPVKAKLNDINSPQRLATQLDRLETSGVLETLDHQLLVSIFERSGRNKEAARVEMTIAVEALQEYRHDRAFQFLKRAIDRLASMPGDGDDSLRIKATIQFSSLCFIGGKGFGSLPDMLEVALEKAQMMGDQRSAALLSLHLGRVFYFADRRSEALTTFARGWEEVKKLGDPDILSQAAEFLGIYFFMQGLFSEALVHLARCVKNLDSPGGNSQVSPIAPLFFGYCMAYLGRFHDAIGFLDYQWRLSKETLNLTQATTIRAVLGTVLVLIRKMREASLHLTEARQEALDQENDFALYLAEGGLAYHYFQQGEIRKARKTLEQAIDKGRGSGLIRQYSSPWILEMIHEFERLGNESIPDMSFAGEFERIMREPNIHLRGVALRLRARQAAESRQEISGIWTDLETSEDYLRRSEDPVQLAKSRLSMARVKLCEGNRTEASLLAKKAHYALAGHSEEFFPDDLRFLLEIKGPVARSSEPREEAVKRFLDMLDELFPSTDFTELLKSAVAATNRLFGAERGGLFWSRDANPSGPPELLAGCNLTTRNVSSKDFEHNLKLIRKTLRRGSPMVVRINTPVQFSSVHQVKAILCLPIEIQGKVQGVLYHDNSYINDCFDFLDTSLMMRLAHHLTTYIRRIRVLEQKIEQSVKFGIEDAAQREGAAKPGLLAESPAMLQILRQTDQIAALDSTALILGETGVGKELLAQRLHSNSPRRENPFVVVDLNTIPENLVESELFGHEKGAFTGADRQKRGRIELAHRGTLFIDELGEIPKSIQVKLLRTLQEKTLVRVGGHQTIHVDFRLVAATNRDLAAEVAAGRFREDLYYRVNVVSLTIPPLRDRKEDILLLANFYLQRYSSKYHRTGLALTKEDEAAFLGYDWPGNVRELKNIMERTVILSAGSRLELGLPTGNREIYRNPFEESPTLDEVQRRYIEYVLEKTSGRIGGPNGAAEILGMKRTTLINRMKSLGIR